ncbi:MAG: stage 0 sporulation family protein [Oligoflexales bacterium]
MERYLVGVQFQTAGKIYSFLPGNHDVAVGESVVVESDRGTSLARVVRIQFDEADEGLEYKEILRKANSKDTEVSTRLLPEDVVDYTRKKVVERELGMKVLKADVVFGGNKVVVYFTAPGRVDFRELVKDLAGGLKTRVELKQVGARDATKVVGGVGVCGRAYCCSTFLREFVPVSIRMAKNQNLALNPMKTAGACGRLLCCLTYEDDTYTHLRKQLPPRGVLVKFEQDGVNVRAKVKKSDLLNQKVVVEDESGQSYQVNVADIEILGETKSASATASPEKRASTPVSDDDWAADLDLSELQDFSQNNQKKKMELQKQEHFDAKQKDSGHRGGQRPKAPSRSSRSQYKKPSHKTSQVDPSKSRGDQKKRGDQKVRPKK